MYKNSRKAILFGVCSGISETLKVNPTFLRILFLFLALAYGTGFLLYLILAFTLQDKYVVTFGLKERLQVNYHLIITGTKSLIKELFGMLKRDLSRQFEDSPFKYLGSLILLFGFFLFLSTLGFFSWLTITRIIAILVIVIGFWIYNFRV